MSVFQLKPNQSLTPRDKQLGFMLLGVVLGGLSVRFAMVGVWLIIPFLIADFVAVWCAFRWLQQKSEIHESITIDDRQLRIEHHQKCQNKSWTFDLHWVRVRLQTHTHAWQPSRLIIGSHGKWIQLADFLTDDERAGLSVKLNSAINEHLSHV